MVEFKELVRHINGSNLGCTTVFIVFTVFVLLNHFFPGDLQIGRADNNNCVTVAGHYLASNEEYFEKLMNYKSYNHVAEIQKLIDKGVVSLSKEGVDVLVLARHHRVIQVRIKESGAEFWSDIEAAHCP